MRVRGRLEERRPTTITITLDVTPELQAELARQAAAHGMGVDAYAASLLQEAVHAPASAHEPVFDQERARPRNASASYVKASRWEA